MLYYTTSNIMCRDMFDYVMLYYTMFHLIISYYIIGILCYFMLCYVLLAGGWSGTVADRLSRRASESCGGREAARP